MSIALLLCDSTYACLPWLGWASHLLLLFVAVRDQLTRT
eukprot:IDg22756t1